MTEPTQLERLAKPFPPEYVKAPAQGKYGSYVPHDVVQQALLRILGPVDIAIGEVFLGQDGKVEGCLVTIRTEVDGRPVSVTEIGDCEKPDNWKTQGARMKDAISDGVKRCSMRLGLGLHLWAQEDYFLFKALVAERTSGESSAPGSTLSASALASSGAEPTNAGAKELGKSGPGDAHSLHSPPAALATDAEAVRGSERAERTPHADREPPASALSVEVAPAPSMPGASSPNPPQGTDDAPGPSPNQLQHAKSRVSALLAAKVKVADEREKRLLPPLKAGIGDDEFALWLVMLDELEAKLVSA